MTASESAGQGAARAGAVVSRFAPSPTGRLHLGHALSAIRAHDLARADGGRFLLRIEDIDGTRSRRAHVATILDDLAWLGLAWDDLSFQSERLALYADALDRLRAMGLVYPCFCTRAEIAASASAPHGPAGAVYPGTCREIDASGRMTEPHCWRLDMAKAVARAGVLTWHDARAGLVMAAPVAQGDIVLARKDAPSSYHLAVTVDDAAQGVTDIVRGADLFDATHIHRLLQALLGLPTPRYHHHPLLIGADGERLAKRHGAPTLAAMREAGADGPALADAIRAGALPNGVTSAQLRSIMQTFLVLLFIGAMIATVVALVRGIVTFLKDAGEEARGGGTGDGPSARALKSNRMMQMRILWQGVAIILLVLILFSAAGRT